MSFPAYPDYKNSGVEWANELPAHWKTVALKWVSRIYAGGTPDKSKPYYWENGSIPWLNSGAVNQVLISEPSSYITIEAFNSSSASWIPAASLVIALAGQGKTKGMVPQLAIKTTCNQSMAAIVPDLPVVSRYLFWWLSSNYQNIRNMAGGDLRDGLNLELIGNIAALMPTEAEQTQIARFLDHETARIDALIEEQQRLIELLKEKRQAVISHTVTKGLDPTVPMKDSGVEWLGEVPAHWVVSRAKLVSDIFVPQRNKPELNDSEGIPWVTMEDMNGGYISATNLKVTELAAREAGSKVLKKGAVIASCVGRFGIVAINAVDVVINQQLQAFEPRKIKAEYLRSIVSLSKEYFELIGTAATLVYVNQQGFENLPVLVPSAGEQESICLYIDEANARFDALLSQSFESIQLLQERRSALISAAVTGKIDVRDWQPPASAQAPESAVAEAV